MLRVLQISMTVLVSVAAIFFACAEGNPLAGITPLLALLTLYFVDVKRVIVVPTVIAALLGVCAFLAAGLEFFSDHLEARLLAGGHLLVYLSWVFLIQVKEHRHYWWLAALSLLQMAVASVLTTEPWFGMALLFYAFVASWTLAVFSLHRAVGDEVASPAEVTSAPLRMQKRRPSLRIGDAWRGISRDVDHRLLNWRFVGSTLVVTCLSLAISVLFFIFTPRIWIGEYTIFSDDPIEGNTLTGFTDEVRLGDMGEILESSDPVMEIKLFHRDPETEFRESEYGSYLGSEPLFRGAVMEYYRDGRWQRGQDGELARAERGRTFAPILQRVHLHPIGTSTLFAYGNVDTVRSEEEEIQVLREMFTDEFIRGGEQRRRQSLRYTVYADEGPPDQNAASRRAFWRRYELQEFRNYLGRLSGLPARLEQLEELTLRLAGDAGSPREAADRIEAYLRDSGEFTYSLRLHVEDPSLDPIEDFLINRKQGHCEYYASAMTMMLRALGIPSRMVSGFKGGTYNRRRRAYLVQQLHAHAWVEAFINGRWHTFDPTPATRGESVAAIQGAISPWSRLRQSMRGSWEFGIRMSQTQQRDMIYRPIAESARSVWGQVQELLHGNLSGVRSLWEFIRSPHRWISWQGGILAFVLMTAIAGIVWLIRQILRAIPWSARRRKERERRRQIEFYDRFLKILGKHKIRQKKTQTAREFVHESLDSLNGMLARAGLEKWPDELVSTFYRVRFGGENLTREEADEVDRRLHQLENCLSNGHQASPEVSLKSGDRFRHQNDGPENPA
jgi:protein-glutamine gamma-glutamyltransferase